MKKILSILIVAVMLMSFAAISAGAVDPAKTIVDVKSGDQITYKLAFSELDDPVVGCDLSVYYDPSTLEVVSVADFNDKTSGWQSTINPDKSGTGEIIELWSILDGVDFSSKRNAITVTFKAKTSGSTNVSYYVRDMYPEDMIEYTDYKFTCDVLRNGEVVLENAAPELNVNNEQDRGGFVNSVDGDSDNAGVDTNVNNNNGDGSNVEVNENVADNQDNNNSDKKSDSKSDKKTDDTKSKADGSDEKETAVAEVMTDAQGNVIINEKGDVADSSNPSSGVPVWAWIIIALVVLGGGGGAAYYFLKVKKGTSKTDE